MKKRWLFLLVIGLAGALPLSASADVTLITTPDGLKFTVGLREKFVVLTSQDHDLTEHFRFTSFISPDIAFGDSDLAIHNFANLTFTMEKGPLRIHANLEMEAAADAASTDVNNPNLERIALYYQIPVLGTLGIGLDVHAFDPEGALIYTDEHPGIWLVGSSGNIGWDLMWHRVLDCNRGTSLFGQSAACRGALGGLGADPNSDQFSDIFGARVNIAVTPHTTISPLLVYYRRYVPQVGGINEYSCPNDPTAACFPLVAGVPTPADSTADFSSRSDQIRPGVILKHTIPGILTITGEAVGLFGEIRDVGTGFLGGKPCVTASCEKDSYDLSSFAVFFEVALDGAVINMPGWTPYVNFEWHRGDDDPFDNEYNGYVPISNLSAALRKDGFKGQSISAYGPPVLGANSEDGWGFDVTARGVGPTLGSIVPDETLGPLLGDARQFNNRGGKAGNPGFFKVSGGVLGKVEKNWDFHFGVSAFWYDALEAIEAEAGQNCAGRATFPGCAALDPQVTADVKTAISALKANGLSFSDSFMGVEINANVGYNINNFRIQPYVSVFVPGSIVEDINGAFLGTTTTSRSDAVTGFTGGVEFSAAF